MDGIGGEGMPAVEEDKFTFWIFIFDNHELVLVRIVQKYEAPLCILSE